MECIVHFELIREDKVSPLRGVVDIEPGTKPSIDQLLQMFKDMDLGVTLENADRYIFSSLQPDDRYKIQVKKFDTGDKKEQSGEDNELKSIISNLMPQSRPI